MGCDGNGVGGAMELLKAFKSPFSSRVGKKIFCPPILRFYFDLIFSASPILRYWRGLYADRLREPDPTTMWYLQIGPEAERIR